MSLIQLSAVRAQAATALAPLDPSEPDVLIDVVDAVSPPVILLVWADPWLTPRAQGPCYFDAELDVACVAGRLEPGAGIEKLEQMVEHVIERMRADAYSWPQASSQAPRIQRIGDVPYLTARVRYRIPVTTNGG